MSWISHFKKKNNSPHLLQANFSLLVWLRGKKADSRPERSTEYYDLHLNIANTKEFEILEERAFHALRLNTT